MVQVAWTELRALFYSPIAWLLLIIFIVQSSNAFLDQISEALFYQVGGREGFFELTFHVFVDGRGLSGSAQQNLFLYIPLLTMGLVSRELQSGSIKLLLSSPVRITDIVFGKYLAVVTYCLLLALVMAALMGVGSFTIEALDYGMVFSGILGIFLLACAYAAIGLFMSTLTSYQIVAALGTLAALFAFSFVGGIGQDIPILNKVTYWLGTGGRAEAFRLGLISTRHVCYFVSIVGLFLGLAVLKLSSGRRQERTAVKACKYGAVVLTTVAFGYTTSIPALTGNVDMTQTKSQSLPAASVEIIEAIEGDWKITSYLNVLDWNNKFGLPKARNFDLDQHYEIFLRHNPKLKMEYVLYYGPSVNNFLYEQNPGKSDEDLARKFAEEQGLDFDDILTPAEIAEVIDLKPEKFRSLRRVEWNGESALIRMYNDLQRFASTEEKSAALKRLLIGPKMVAIVTGHGERSAYAMGDASYQRILTDVTYRRAMINHGFDVMEVSLDEPIPYDTDILIVADPKIAYSGDELQRIETYIAGGGNLLITAEPGGQDILNPIIEKLGARILPGQMFQEQEEFPAEVLFAGYGENAPQYFFKVSEREKIFPLLLSGVAGLVALEGAPFNVTPILVSKKKVTWHQEVVSSPNTFVASDPVATSKVSTPLALALSPEISGAEQRIMVFGDADFMSNAGLHTAGTKTINYDFVPDIFTWLSNEDYPINAEPMDFPDKRILINQIGIRWLKVVLYGVIPSILLVLGATILVSRRRR